MKRAGIGRAFTDYAKACDGQEAKGQGHHRDTR